MTNIINEITGILITTNIITEITGILLCRCTITTKLQ